MLCGEVRPAAGLSTTPSRQPGLLVMFPNRIVPLLDSAIGQGCGQHSTVAPGLVGPPTVLRDHMVLPAMLCIQVGPEIVS